MMKREQMEVIAKRASQLAVSGTDVADKQSYSGDPLQDCYEEYMDQLQSGDDQWLRYWIGLEVASGVREAVEILKMWIGARFTRCERG